MPNPLTLPSGYTVEFLGGACFEDAILGTLQTFNYRLTLPDVTIPACEISDFAIELCDNHVVLQTGPFAPTTPNNTPVLVETNTPLQPCMSSLDPTAQAQIKFDNLNNATAAGNYSFTIQGCFLVDDVTLALKVGNACPLGGCQGGLIPGPSCTEAPPPPPPGCQVRLTIDAEPCDVSGTANITITVNDLPPCCISVVCLTVEFADGNVVHFSRIHNPGPGPIFDTSEEFEFCYPLPEGTVCCPTDPADIIANATACFYCIS